jgi:hypothetical protein
MYRLRWWLVSGAGIPWALRIGARVSSTHPTGQRACRRPANFIVGGQLVTRNTPKTGELLINPRFAAFARHWGFTAKACRPNRPQTKGKDERGVQYVKGGGIAGHAFERWGQMEGHLEWWNREVADMRIHGTTGEQPLARFLRHEAAALKPLAGKPSFLAERECSRMVAKDCCVQVEGNWYSVPQTLVRQRVEVQIRVQTVVIRYQGAIVARHPRQQANHRHRQVLAGHWDGLLPQRSVEQAIGSVESTPQQKGTRGLQLVRTSALARSLSDYEAVIQEVAL